MDGTDVRDAMQPVPRVHLGHAVHACPAECACIGLSGLL
jgi:hypothetical protein